MSQLDQLQSTQFQLQNQAQTGLKISLPEDNPAVMNQVLDLQTQADANNQYQTNITQVQSTASAASTAMNSLQTLVEQASEIATSSDSTENQQQLSNNAIQVGSLLQQAIQLGNSKDANGNYIFGGTANQAPPFAATTDANGNITGVTYQGNTSTAQVAISTGFTVSAQIPGANSSGSGPTGLFTDSRSGADLFNHLIALKNDLTSGNVAAISATDKPNLTTDQDNIISQIGSNGVLQSTLETVGASTSQRGTSLDTQISNATSASLPDTLTKLSQTQTSLQAALQSGVMIMQLSILNYLP
jgi:flagellar hook-associated protein 3 FlgL